MRYLCLIYDDEKAYASLSTADHDSLMAEYRAFGESLQKGGHYVGGYQLAPTTAGRTVRIRDGKVSSTDGPYAETKEQLGGIGVVEARDIAHAIELVSGHPGLHVGVTFEVRPIDEETLQRQAASFAKWRGTAPATRRAGARFATIGYINETGAPSASKAEFEELIQQCIAYDEERFKSGQWLSGIKLQSVQTAKTLRAKAGRVVITDGPFAETKECLGGVVVLALQNMSDAVALIARHPALAFGVVIEIRPVDEEVEKRWEATRGRVHSG
jgi:hypothetical protein